jgi:beta-lactamase class A
MTESADDQLHQEIERIRESAGAQAGAVAFHDYETGASFAHEGDRWFHAASIIKVPMLLGVFAAMVDGEIDLNSRVQIRNRFLSAYDESPFRVDSSRDADSEVHAQIGKTMKLRDLVRQMITTSSNLATNLLVDLVGIEELQNKLARLGAEGIELRRGVEDEVAYENGISNRVTARGMISILRLIEEGVLSSDSSKEMLNILHDQEFRSGIPAGLPDNARVANKTGEISTVAHDVGLVYLPDREPYVVCILTEWDAAATSGRRETLASLSRAVFRHLTMATNA